MSKYEASSSVYAVGLENEDAFSEEVLVNDYCQIALSQVVVNEVQKKLSQDSNNSAKKFSSLTYEDFKKKVNVSSEYGTRVIYIKVKDKNPQAAAIVANSMAEVLILRANIFSSTDNLKLLDRAVVPSKPVGGSLILLIAICFILGFGASIACVFLLEYFDDRIRSAEDIKMILEMPVLGVVSNVSR